MRERVDIWWDKNKKLKAFLYWKNKRGGIGFFLETDREMIERKNMSCSTCMFFKKGICRMPVSLCTKLWFLKGNNQFEGRKFVDFMLPYGPIFYKKVKDKF